MWISPQAHDASAVLWRLHITWIPCILRVKCLRTQECDILNLVSFRCILLVNTSELRNATFLTILLCRLWLLCVRPVSCWAHWYCVWGRPEALRLHGPGPHHQGKESWECHTASLPVLQSWIYFSIVKGMPHCITPCAAKLDLTLSPPFCWYLPDVILCPSSWFPLRIGLS